MDRIASLFDALNSLSSGADGGFIGIIADTFTPLGKALTGLAEVLSVVK